MGKRGQRTSQGGQEHLARFDEMGQMLLSPLASFPERND